jgi:hypothetical protein
LDSEPFLASFHDANPGVTPRAFASLTVRCAGRRSRLPMHARQARSRDRVSRSVCGDGFLPSLFARRGQKIACADRLYLASATAA